MTRPRKDIVCIEHTPYYHITSRCVRQTYLCGIDHHTGRSYEHRKQWIVDRLRLLASIFAVELCAYSVMSNHYHIVLKLTPKLTHSWTDEQVIQHWTSLYKGPLLVQQYQAGQPLSSAEMVTLKEIICVWRQRLAALDWFMKCLNETIARAANKEDQCTGHFWEARYTSQALPSKEAILSCMAYVDLNPVRAGITNTPETSDYTSVKERITPQFNLNNAIQEQVTQGALLRFDVPLKPLSSFTTHIINKNENQPPAAVNVSFIDYLKLLDWTGRIVRHGKHGVIPPYAPPILERLSIASKNWLLNSQHFEYIHAKTFLKRKNKNSRSDKSSSKN